MTSEPCLSCKRHVSADTLFLPLQGGRIWSMSSCHKSPSCSQGMPAPAFHFPALCSRFCRLYCLVLPTLCLLYYPARQPLWCPGQARPLCRSHLQLPDQQRVPIDCSCWMVTHLARFRANQAMLLTSYTPLSQQPCATRCSRQTQWSLSTSGALRVDPGGSVGPANNLGCTASCAVPASQSLGQMPATVHDQGGTVSTGWA